MIREHQTGFRAPLLATALALAVGGLAHPTTAGAVEYKTQWIDWYAKGPGQVFGTLQQGSEQVQVTLEGDYFGAFTDELPEPYWGPKTTYLNSVVDLQPPRSDVIIIAGGPSPLKLSFSQSLANPILAIASLGLKDTSGTINLAASMEFDQPFRVLSNGPNYYAGGLYSNFLQTGTVLTGVESSGTIQFEEPLTHLQWLSQFPERDAEGNLVGTYIFTLGVNCDGYRIGPTPMTEAGAVPKGCLAYNDRPFEQKAPLEVRGELRNQAGGDWLQAEALRVAGDARMINTSHYMLGEGKTLTVDGRLTNGADLDVRGVLQVNAGGRVDHIGGLVTLKADNTLPDAGLLRIEQGASYTNFSGVLLFEGPESLEGMGGRAQVAGVLTNQLTLNLDGYNAEMEVLPGGRLSNQGLMTVTDGSLLNRGEMWVEWGGELLFEREPFEFVGHKPLLDNRGTLTIRDGGLMRVQGEPRLGGEVTGSVTSITNGAQGTIQVDGELRLDGQLINAGRVDVGDVGTLSVNGSGSFDQQAGGSLTFAGAVALEGGGSMRLAGSATTAGSGELSIGFDSTLTIEPGGNLRFAPGNLGLTNHGTLVNKGILTLETTFFEEAGESHENWGELDNRGQLRIGPHATLLDFGEIKNSGRFVVDADGRLITSVVNQTATGVFVNNGLVQGGVDNVFVKGGRITGKGTFAAPAVEFLPGEFTFIDPGQSPGTLSFTGDLILNYEVTVNLEFTENDGADRLVVGGQLQGGGATVKFLFPDGATPGLDQVFTFLETAEGLSSDLNQEIPEGRYARFYDQGPAGAAGSLIAVAFASPDAGWLLPEEVGDTFFLIEGMQRYVEAQIQRPGGEFVNEGMLGIRNLEGAGLGVGRFYNGAPGQLLNSARFSADSQFDNLGLVKNRAGALFVNGGELTNHAGARFENRGTLQNEAGSRIVNQGELLVLGEVLGQGIYAQQGDQAETVVDGLLQAEHIRIHEGTLSGAGVIQGHLALWGGSLEPGNSPGTLTVDGSLNLFGGEVVIELASALVHDRIVVTGSVYGGPEYSWGEMTRIRFRLLEGYTPAVGDGWTWLETGGVNYSHGLNWLLEALAPDGLRYHLLADAAGVYDAHGRLPDRAHFEFTGDRLFVWAEPAPVPLPAALPLFASALLGAGLLGRLRRRASRDSPGTETV